jgi:hypothetical protein
MADAAASRRKKRMGDIEQRVVLGCEPVEIACRQRDPFGGEREAVGRAFDDDGPAGGARVAVIGDDGEFGIGVGRLGTGVLNPLPQCVGPLLCFGFLLAETDVEIAEPFFLGVE